MLLMVRSESPSHSRVHDLFSPAKQSPREKILFDQFGFEKIHLVEIDPPLKKTFSKKALEPTPTPTLSNITISESKKSAESVSPKILKKNTLPTKLIYDNPDAGKMDLDMAKQHLSSFSEEEKIIYFWHPTPIVLASIPLEHFVKAREAALAFNWLSRQKSIYHKDPTGDLILDKELRVAARTLHANANAESAENWGTLSTVLDSFHEKFPTDSLSLIPINLQLHWNPSINEF